MDRIRVQEGLFCPFRLFLFALLTNFSSIFIDDDCIHMKRTSYASGFALQVICICIYYCIFFYWERFTFSIACLFSHTVGIMDMSNIVRIY